MHITLSSKGQIALPKAIRDALNLSKGARLSVELRGQQVVISKEGNWRKLYGAIHDDNLVADFSSFRKEEQA